jgi:two-component system response regulator FixJ
MTDYIVHVIDDDAAVRRSLQLLILSAGFLVETYASAAEYQVRDPVDRQGCILLDVQMPNVDGLTFLERQAALQTSLPVVIMTGQSDIESAVKAMKLGAVEFLQKPFTEDALFAAIAATRERPMQRLANSEMAEAPAQIAALSPRERDVLTALAAGHPQKRIAYDLGISVRTVEVHRARMMRRLGVRSLAEAVTLLVLARHRGEE